MKDKHGMIIDIGSHVNVTPDLDNVCTEDFTGVIRKIRMDTDLQELATVEDQTNDLFEFGEHEIELECE